MSDNEEKLFETGKEKEGDVSKETQIVEETPKQKGKHKKPMSEARRAQLKEQLKKAREASLAKRRANAKAKKETKEAKEIVGIQEKSDDEGEVEIVKKPRKKAVRIVEETEEEMESRIEKRVRLKLEKQKEKEDKERARQKELEDLRSEVALLKQSKEKKKEEVEEPKSDYSPMPRFSQFSVLRKNRYGRFH